MTVKVGAGVPAPTYLRGVDLAFYAGDERVTLNGAAVTCTLARDTNRFLLAAEGGDVRYQINKDATAASPGYVAENSLVEIAISNLASLSVYGAASTFANLIYYRQP